MRDPRLQEAPGGPQEVQDKAGRIQEAQTFIDIDWNTLTSVGTHAYIHTYIHTYIHKYIHTYIHTYVTYIHTYIHYITCIHTYIHYIT